MKILDHIHIPADLKLVSEVDLPQLAQELRAFVLENTVEKKGHIESSLTVTELTVALHYVLNTPHDNLFWDVGHQAYIHKILTGRKDRFKTNRIQGGLSGFPNADESEYDLFTTGHSSTSISAIAGLATASRLLEDGKKHVAVIGDGALNGGMAYEALNYLGEAEEDVLIVLNDNRGSIDANIGGLQGQDTYPLFFESLGVYYLGKVDGHDLSALIPALKSALNEPGPRVLHVITQKEILPALSKSKTDFGFQEAMTTTLIEEAKTNPKIVAISPAMLSGAGLNAFAEAYPQRCFDVGIAEQNAVTMAAGMARAGFKPFCHLYSTFAQRAYDQIIHDVALQNLPVVFLLDRAGLVGEDGPTHHGVFDLAFLNPIPNLVIGSPANPHELQRMVLTALECKKPFVIRYPRGGDRTEKLVENAQPLKVGKAKWLKEGSGKIAIASLGHLSSEVKKSFALLGDVAAHVSHVDMRFLKPMDLDAVAKLAQFKTVITVENGCIKGGFGKTVALALRDVNFRGSIQHLGLPDAFIEHGDIDTLYHQNGLSASGIAETILSNI